MAPSTPSIARRKGVRSKHVLNGAMGTLGRQTVLMLLALALALLIFTIGIVLGSRGIQAGTIGVISPVGIDLSQGNYIVSTETLVSGDLTPKRRHNDGVLRHPNQELLDFENGGSREVDDETQREAEELQEIDDTVKQLNKHMLAEEVVKVHVNSNKQKANDDQSMQQKKQNLQNKRPAHAQLRVPPLHKDNKPHPMYEPDVGKQIKQAIHDRQQILLESMAQHNDEEEASLKNMLKVHANTMKDFGKHHFRQGSKASSEKGGGFDKMPIPVESIPLEEPTNLANSYMKESNTNIAIEKISSSNNSTEKVSTKEKVLTEKDFIAGSATEKNSTDNVSITKDINQNDSNKKITLREASPKTIVEPNFESFGIELHPFTRATLPNAMSKVFQSDGTEGTKVIFSSWIRLDPPEDRYVGSKRILSVGPDISDCLENDLEHHRLDQLPEHTSGKSGMIRFYVNHDETADEILVLEWSPGAGRGCYKVEGFGYQVEGKEWVHVAFSIDPAIWIAKIYINGELVADEQNEEAAGISSQGISQDQTMSIPSNTSDPSSTMFLGRGMEQLDDEGQLTMTLDGRITSVAIWNDKDTEQRVLVSPYGEVGMLQKVFELGPYVDPGDLSDQLRALQPDLVYPLSEGATISAMLADAKDVEVDLKEIKQDRNGHLSLKYDRVVKMASPERVMKTFQQPIQEEISNQPPNPFADFEPLGGNRYPEYKDGTREVKITPEMEVKSDEDAKVRREAVKNSMKYAWSHYKERAFGFDEIKPVSGFPDNGWKGIGVTLVDALDTLWLMDMKDEFWEARDWVRDHLSFEHVDHVGIFEITIRSLGGLLSAYDLSGDKVFLTKAEDLGSRLLHAFESPNGIPYGQTELNGHRSFNEPWQGGSIKLAECGTLQLEFRFLSEATGNPIYAEKVNKVFDMLGKAQPSDGLYPLFVRNDRPGVYLENDHVTLGANADSFYEYMLKVWLQGGQNESLYRSMWDKAVKGVQLQLVEKNTADGLTFVAERKFGRVECTMDHLACFFAGALALGAYTHPDGLQSTNAQRDLKVGKELTYTCYQMYARTATGLSPELVECGGTNEMNLGNAKDYRLRPEVVESFFILHHLTGDPVYREWGWEVFQAIEKYCRTSFGYGQYPDVSDPTRRPEDKMESFFMAETLKYLYLLFDPDNTIDLMNTHVFNTEAHPLRRFDVLRKQKTATS